MHASGELRAQFDAMLDAGEVIPSLCKKFEIWNSTDLLPDAVVERNKDIFQVLTTTGHRHKLSYGSTAQALYSLREAILKNKPLLLRARPSEQSATPEIQTTLPAPPKEELVEAQAPPPSKQTLTSPSGGLRQIKIVRREPSHHETPLHYGPLLEKSNRCRGCGNVVLTKFCKHCGQRQSVS
jgi:hypothetical protein